MDHFIELEYEVNLKINSTLQIKIGNTKKIGPFLLTQVNKCYKNQSRKISDNKILNNIQVIRIMNILKYGNKVASLRLRSKLRYVYAALQRLRRQRYEAKVVS